MGADPKDLNDHQPEEDAAAAEIVETNEKLEHPKEDKPLRDSGKVFAGQRAEFALNPTSSEETKPEGGGETEEALKRATRDR